MTPTLSKYLNKAILVSIPSLFEDGKCRTYKLLGAELNGLWLESQELTERLIAEKTGNYAPAAPAVFVPFAQIAAVLVETRAPRAPSPQPGMKEEPSSG